MKRLIDLYIHVNGPLRLKFKEFGRWCEFVALLLYL